MNIAHFTSTYQPLINGVVRSITTFQQALKKLNHNVFIFAPQAAKYKDVEPNIYRYPALETSINSGYPISLPYSRSISRLLPSLELDVIHSHHPLGVGQAATRNAAKNNLPMVFTFHTRYRDYSHYFTPHSSARSFVKEAIDFWLYDYIQKCHHIITPGESIKQLLIDKYGISGQITAIPTGMNLEPYKTANGQLLRQQLGWGDDIVLISAGRLAKEKNWGTLLEAVAQVIQQENRRVRLVLIGEGKDKTALAQLAQTLGIANRVDFTGNIPFDQMPNYLKAADLFCFASVTETQGLVTMEALAAGLPIVAVAATGTSDVVEHEQQGILTENNSRALAKAIENVLNNKPLRQRLSAAALQRAKVFDIARQTQQLLAVYNLAAEAQKENRYVPISPDKQLANPVYSKLGYGFVLSLAMLKSNFKKKKGWLPSTKSA